MNGINNEDKKRRFGGELQDHMSRPDVIIYFLAFCLVTELEL